MIRNQLKQSIYAVAAFAIVLFFPAAASACGTVQHGIAFYNDAGGTNDGRVRALKILAGTCSGYAAVESDRLILPILSDAIARGLPRDAVQAAFEKLRCLQGVRKSDEYAVLAKQLEMAKCPTAAELENWRVVSVDYANLRRRPTASSTRVGAAARGTILEVSNRSGDWLSVTTWEGDKGFVRQDLVTPFLKYGPAQ